MHGKICKKSIYLNHINMPLRHLMHIGSAHQEGVISSRNGKPSATAGRKASGPQAVESGAIER